MRAFIFWIGVVAVFSVINGMITHKEVTVRNGTRMYVELAPRDPRSLMQGDYMALRYRMDGAPRGLGRRGKFVVRLNDDMVAKIIRIHAGEPLGEGEYLLRYTRGASGTRIGTDSFFFQEGRGQHFADARYGELRVGSSGESVLIALRDAELSELK